MRGRIILIINWQPSITTLGHTWPCGAGACGDIKIRVVHMQQSTISGGEVHVSALTEQVETLCDHLSLIR